MPGKPGMPDEVGSPGMFVGSTDVTSVGRSGPRIVSTVGTVVLRRICAVVEASSDSFHDDRNPRPAPAGSGDFVPRYVSRITMTAEMINTDSTNPKIAPSS